MLKWDDMRLIWGDVRLKQADDAHKGKLEVHIGQIWRELTDWRLNWENLRLTAQ